MSHATSVSAGSEDCKTVVRCAEGFDALVGLLTVVEAGSHTVDGQVGGADEGRGGPLGGLDAVVGFDVTVHSSRRISGEGDRPLNWQKYLLVLEIQYHSNLILFSCCKRLRVLEGLPMVSVGGGGKGMIAGAKKELSDPKRKWTFAESILYTKLPKCGEG